MGMKSAPPVMLIYIELQRICSQMGVNVHLKVSHFWCLPTLISLEKTMKCAFKSEPPVMMDI